MVFAKLQGCLEWYQNAMTGHFLDEVPDNRILLSKELLSVVAAHDSLVDGVEGAQVGDAADTRSRMTVVGDQWLTGTSSR